MSNAAVIAAIREHHDQLASSLVEAALALRRAVDRGDSGDAERQALVRVVRDEVLPHAAAEEETLYAEGAGRPETALLVQAMVADHRVLQGLVGELGEAAGPGELAGAAEAFRTVFLAHLVKENDLLLPALDRAGVALGVLLEGMHELLGSGAAGHHAHGESSGEPTA